MFEFSLLQKFSIWVIPVLFAITVHEVAHGWVARRFGDSTAFILGRLSLNPFKHIDPVGTVLIPAVMLFLPGGFIFGWAKPVPVDYRNLKHPKRDMVYVAAAGPFANLLMVILWALIVRLGTLLIPAGVWYAMPLVYMGCAGIFINSLLMIVNMIPLPPLDGGRVLTGLLPGTMAWKFSQIEPYGMWILIALLLTGALGTILSPILSIFLSIIAPISGLSVKSIQTVVFSLM